MALDTQIDALCSTVFQESNSPMQTLAYVDRLLSAFREVGRAIHPSPSFCNGLYTDGDLLDN